MHMRPFYKVSVSVFMLACVSACAGQPPSNLGSQSQPLAQCPSTPNCVSSYDAVEDSHYIKPISSKLSIKAKHQKLTQIISNTDNTQITQSSPAYIRAEYTSAFWGFVDDVEFVLEDTQIQMRSASRLGYSDLGVNRKRLESIRSEFVTP